MYPCACRDFTIRLHISCDRGHINANTALVQNASLYGRLHADDNDFGLYSRAPAHACARVKALSLLDFYGHRHINRRIYVTDESMMGMGAATAGRAVSARSLMRAQIE